MPGAARLGRLRWIALAALSFFFLYRWTSSSDPSPPPQGSADDPIPAEVYKRAREPDIDHSILGIGRHSGTIIFIHLPLVGRLRPKLWQVSWVLPNSPHMAFTGMQGQKMFDMDELPLPQGAPMPKREDEAHMQAAVARVHGLIQAEIDKGIDANRIVLAGFSQGCATTLLAGLSTKEKLGGLMCLSGWLPMAYKIQKSGSKETHPMQTSHAHEVPVFWGHGAADSVIQFVLFPYAWGEQSIAHLTKMGFSNIEFHTYPDLQHWVATEEEDDMLAWFQKILPPT
ncbi:hypothetical protein Rhopal_000355-T1 [Rhodotorula paludigena]|uniref:Acyl-protein thioesterase 1 n=1 Tax=Rhodotorula paludigena TaxID=86838 RepID=A0AAV5G4L4_9BASI|nr:hypothetical protein Rhopal_000355-T1 [Rhodotorula paludigena]